MCWYSRLPEGIDKKKIAKKEGSSIIIKNTNIMRKEEKAE